MEAKTRLEKYKVCDQCHSVGIVEANCQCTYGKYSTIELEFEVCECCGNLLNDGYPADTPFNDEQFQKLEKDGKNT